MEKESFETNIKKLEEIVAKLENGNLSLEEAICNFEEGIKLSKVATSKLDEAEKKINMLLINENGEAVEESFDVED